jgi:hypothetical protein
MYQKGYLWTTPRPLMTYVNQASLWCNDAWCILWPATEEDDDQHGSGLQGKLDYQRFDVNGHRLPQSTLVSWRRRLATWQRCPDDGVQISRNDYDFRIDFVLMLADCFRRFSYWFRIYVGRLLREIFILIWYWCWPIALEIFVSISY